MCSEWCGVSVVKELECEKDYIYMHLFADCDNRYFSI